MAMATVMADRHFVDLILQRLSNMKWRDRFQYGPEQRVELHEYRPTLVPSILVNKLWADIGRSILWKRYPPLPCLKPIAQHRRQIYADMIEHLFVVQPFTEEDGDIDFLAGLDWTKLKSLELELDWKRYEPQIKRLLHPGLENIQLAGVNVASDLLPTLLQSCESLQSIYLSPTTIDPAHPLRAQVLIDLLENRRRMKSIRLFEASILEKDRLFRHLSQGFDQLEELEYDLDPGLQLLPLLGQPPSPFFPSLKRLQIMCYPEIALVLPSLFPLIEDLHVDIARIPDQHASESDSSILNDIITQINHCPTLRSLRLDIGPLAMDFPSPDMLPILTGPLLINLGKSCPHLQHLALSASEPAAIDATSISSPDFDNFCGLVKNLEHLSLKFDPVTAAQLEEDALSSLSRHCPKLEVLRIRCPLRLNNSDGIELTVPTPETKTDANEQVSSTEPRPFSHVTHLALSRPNTILSRTSSPIDPAMAAALVQPLASSILTHFPRLEILEAWSDYLGADKDSLNYFLPLKEPLATSWEFLSGREQNLYEDEGDEEEEQEQEQFSYDEAGYALHGADRMEVEHWDADFEEGETSFESETSGDWELASKMNEFPDGITRVPGFGEKAESWKEVGPDIVPALDDPAWPKETTANHRVKNDIHV